MTHASPVPASPTQKYYALTTGEKKRILLNNLYGVDLDQQAVEVTKLSLLLKMLEGETATTAQPELLVTERVLPDLGDNIEWGNSLIGSDFYEGKQMGLFGDEELYRVKVFDWDSRTRGFGRIMENGGFDAVIGNPPWISLSGKFGNEILSDDEQNYLISMYEGNTYMPNMYEYFVAKGLRLVKENGLFSFIVPDRLGYNEQFVTLRKNILSNFTVISWIYKFPFPRITADTLIFVIVNQNPVTSHKVQIGAYVTENLSIVQRVFFETPNHVLEYFEDATTMQLVNKVSASVFTVPLSLVCDTTSGFGGRSNEIYEERTSSKQIPTIKGDSISKYELKQHYWFDFRKENITGRTTDTKKLGAIPKILLRKTGNSIIATYENTGIFPEQSLYFLFNNHSEMHYLYLLGILNSRLMNYYFQAKALTNKESIAQVKKIDLDKLPIRTIDFDNPDDVAKHDHMVELVETMLDLHRQRPAASGEAQKIITARIESTDREIDQLVYELYGLTDEEIGIVEG